MDTASESNANSGSAPTPATLRVFLNYRREDAEGLAWAVYGRLVVQLGSKNVFFDHASLRPGQCWFDAISSHLDDAHVLLALIGPQWCSQLESRRRASEGEDYVVWEIAAGLRDRAVTVIPLLVDDAKLPNEATLPLAIKSLLACEAHKVRLTNLASDVDELIRKLVERAGASATDAALSGGATAGSLRAVVPEEQALVAPRTERERIVKRSRAEPQFVGREPDDQHCELVAQQLIDDNIVAFVGAGINREDSLGVPDDTRLADLLAEKAKLGSHNADLAEVAQYARAMKGEPPLFRWVREGVGSDCEPGSVHRYLAGLPARLEQLGYERHYPMIVTTKYDVALERAFREIEEPYDAAIYDASQGCFIHVPWDRAREPLRTPNSYTGFPIRAADGALERTVIVRVNGSINDAKLGYEWHDNYVITQDDFIDYLNGRPPEDVVPAQILAKLRTASCLFLGYRMADWRLRVFLRRVWSGVRVGNAKHWAVEPEPTVLERELWDEVGVPLFQSPLPEYIGRLDEYLSSEETDARPAPADAPA